ncbi:multidrug effflux MFS transporter [Conchiformibius steedae DSM 2580]|uniref:Bcr/CflA family efflux transporter n=1 Tax=Conchiformibius steedae DSM 2580 TaxID=1121352 RepID=A0AAE9L0I7_9NEIS|nr:multidrug effflux MFS transporter [Conchiformibius steedae]URD67960.1 multidrug effflux MFS transporter [Conchiformibius steedae DSM 2580]
MPPAVRPPLTDRQMAFLLAMLVAIMPFSVDAYLPALPQMAESLHADIHHIEKSLSSFILGVAVGQLLGGSLSDIKGRKNLALAGLGVYMLGSIGLILVQTANQLLLLRLVQAVGAGMASVVVGAVVRDNYHGREAAQMFALIGIIMMAAPSLAPLIGSLLEHLGGWRLIFGFLLTYGALAFVLIRVFLPKHKRAEPFTRDILHTVLARYRSVLTTRPALGFLFLQAASFSSMLVFLTESPFVYMKLYGLSQHQYAWAFAGNIVVMALFNRTTAWRLRHGSEPKNILLAGIAVQLCANIMLTAGAWHGLPPMAWMLAWCMVSVGTQGLIVANTQALFMEHFSQAGGSANALLLATQSLIAAAVAFTATELHNGTAAVMTTMMLCCTLSGIALLMGFSRQSLFGKP